MARALTYRVALASGGSPVVEFGRGPVRRDVAVRFLCGLIAVALAGACRLGGMRGAAPRAGAPARAPVPVPGPVRGRVVDRQMRRALPGRTVLIGDQRTSTQVDGFVRVRERSGYLRPGGPGCEARRRHNLSWAHAARSAARARRCAGDPRRVSGGAQREAVRLVHRGWRSARVRSSYPRILFACAHGGW